MPDRKRLQGRLEQASPGRRSFTPKAEEAVPAAEATEAAPAVDGTPQTVNGKGKREDVVTWEASHQRATFHLSRDSLKRLQRESKRSGRSKSKLLDELILERFA